MITIEGVCEQLRHYNESNGTEVYVRFNADTSCSLYSAATGNRFLVFGNPYQLTQFLAQHTGIRK